MEPEINQLSPQPPRVYSKIPRSIEVRIMNKVGRDNKHFKNSTNDNQFARTLDRERIKECVKQVSSGCQSLLLHN